MVLIIIVGLCFIIYWINEVNRRGNPFEPYIGEYYDRLSGGIGDYGWQEGEFVWKPFRESWIEDKNENQIKIHGSWVERNRIKFYE